MELQIRGVSKTYANGVQALKDVTLISTASWSQSVAISRTRRTCPEVSPLVHSFLRERLKNVTAPVATVFSNAAWFM
jgi:hypothetical protein